VLVAEELAALAADLVERSISTTLTTVKTTLEQRRVVDLVELICKAAEVELDQELLNHLLAVAVVLLVISQMLEHLPIMDLQLAELRMARLRELAAEQVLEVMLDLF